MDDKHIDNAIQDHETRIRRLEESDIKQQLQLANIEKSQSEIKLMINEGNSKLLDTLISDKKCKTESKILDSKQFWAIIVIIATAVMGYIFKQ